VRNFLGGLVEHLTPDAFYIDHTTNSPELVRRVHAMLAERGLAMLDARPSAAVWRGPVGDGRR
jgi:3-hydroxyisobutyrate dehydrogenase-like beta-hydroxyacid dehydrogenase